MKKAELLDAAKRIVVDRDATYGSARKDFSAQAAIWSVILGVQVTPEKVAACMIGVKLARLLKTPSHIDSIIDIAGYAACMAEVLHEEKT